MHDENAYALGGVAGHAGLFSTASDLAVFAQMMLNGGSYNGTRIVADSTVQLFTRRAAGTRALGWDTCGGKGGCGKYLGSTAYGHTGFTGTSLWIDPEREMFVVLLTNRVHAARARRPAKVITDVRADLADAAALAVTDSREGMLSMPSVVPRRPRGGLEPSRVRAFAFARESRRARLGALLGAVRAQRRSKASASKSKASASKSKSSASKSRASVVQVARRRRRRP